MPRSLAEPVAGKQSAWATARRRKPYLITAKAFLKLAKCRWALCSQALLLAVRGGSLGDFSEAKKLRQTQVAYVIINI